MSLLDAGITLAAIIGAIVVLVIAIRLMRGDPVTAGCGHYEDSPPTVRKGTALQSPPKA